MTKYLLTMLLAIGLAGCGGSSGGPQTKDSTDTDTGIIETPTDDQTTDDLIPDDGVSTVSFLPLMTFELYTEWSGMDNNTFVYQIKDPFINHFMIAPVDSITLQPAPSAKIDDFSLSEDGIPLNPKTNFQMLQKVVGNQVSLDTAIVINTSAAMSTVDRAAFIAEIKAFVSKSRSSSNSAVANQRFTVWGYDGGQKEGDGGIQLETAGFATTTADTHAALDKVLTKWENGAYQVAGANHTYDAVVEAIGRFVGTSPFAVAEDLRDPASGSGADYSQYDDLVDRYTADGIFVTNIVLFSAGYSDTNRFDGDTMIKALNSQSLSVFDTDSGPGGAATSTKDKGKILHYVVPADESKDSVIEGMATTTTEAPYASGKYDFADVLISNQTAALIDRISENNQYLIRFASTIRSGTGHSGELKTRTADDHYGYTLSWKMDRDVIDGSDLNMPEPAVEITGANNEYLSNAKASLSEINRFYPATRWTNTQFQSSDYEWSGTLAYSPNDDGSVTIATNAGAGVLTLRNKVLDRQTSIIIQP